jgi:hypothetical protein
MAAKNWIYFGVFLDERSRERLSSLVNPIIDENWKKFCHHMTIAFNNGSAKAQEAYNIYEPYFGEGVDLIATHIGVSNDAIAVKVDFTGETQNRFPHVTLATPINGKPVNSNYIKNWQPLEKPIELYGTFRAFTKN